MKAYELMEILKRDPDADVVVVNGDGDDGEVRAQLSAATTLDDTVMIQIWG